MTDFIVSQYGLSINPEIVFKSDEVYNIEIRGNNKQPLKKTSITHVRDLKFASIDDEMLTFYNKNHPEFIVSIDMKMIGNDPNKYWITNNDLNKYKPLMSKTIVGREINKALLSNSGCLVIVVFDINNIIFGRLVNSTNEAVNIKLERDSLYTIKSDEDVVENTRVELKINHMNENGSVIVRATKPDGSVISIEEFEHCQFTIMKEVDTDGN